MANSPKRGELYLLKPDATGKRRPIVIVSRDILNRGHRVLAVPFYSQQLEKRQEQEWCELFYAGEGDLDRNCVAKADELSLIDKLDIDLASGAIGTFNSDQMARLERAIKWSVGVS
jgi:mRNA-degrading endonuclease toxin of MazEF toxin-antitoxin module